MIGWTFVYPERVHLLWAAAACVAALALLEARGRQALGRFVSPAMQEVLVTRPSSGRRIARLALAFAALAAGVLALMRPQTPHAVAQPTPGRPTADVMVVLDVSRSMLAQDAAPSRLERAKAEIRDLLTELPGQRVGLVAFAGRAVVLCPLTTDQGFFRLILDSVSPSSVSRGGTRIGDALRAAVAAFPPGDEARLVVLMTDGEDHDSYPLDAAKAADKEGVRIVAIGFGDEKGTEIQVTDPKTGGTTVLTDRSGNAVRSRLDGTTLRQIALATKGAYVPAGVGVLDLESIVKTHVTPLLAAPAGPGQERMAPAERYPWAIMAALACLVAAVWVGSTPGRRS